MTTVIELDSLSMLKDPLDLLGKRSLTQEEEAACAALAERMREFMIDKPLMSLHMLPPKQSLEPVDLMFTFHFLSKDNQRLIIERSKQREPSHLKSIPRFEFSNSRINVT